ncbi:hypothetical protein JY651_41165 [Pyxidicoccus parkwayensis]|uniref:Uncharacterized protein n=1 Tax=Pyxidicoccus parkwayensis TaxID=2813578 RepID=A0ABX7NS50_9BACT|nr:hypothetical protein [Pyxidicoccus parkwaysis]QSQ21528.1 hypothetical protein JY651_41165 [Pyxidicoccus parkwaysis]
MAQSERLQATLPASAMEQLQRLREELGLDTSAVVQEALDLFAKAVLEARRGGRLAFVSPDQPSVIREYSSPSLTRLEWAAHSGKEQIILPEEDFDRVSASLKAPAKPAPALRALSRRRRREKP